MKHIWNILVLSILIASLVVASPALVTITTAYYWIAAITLTIALPTLAICFPLMGEKEKSKVIKNIKFTRFIWNVAYLVVFAFLGWTYLVAMQILLLLIVGSIYTTKFKHKEVA